MELLHFYHRNQLHRLAGHKDFSFFELTIWLHSMARSLVSVFVPILLVQTGYSVMAVVAYYLLFNVIDVPLNFAVERLMRRIGARRVMMLGTMALIAFFALLGVLPADHWPLLVLLAILAAVYDTMFWISQIYIFIEINRHESDAGKTVGALETVRRLAHIAGPMVGGLVLLVGGKLSLTLLSIVLFVFSLLPLSQMHHVHDLPKEKKPSFREFFSDSQEKRDYLSIALWGVHTETEEVLWPLFIFGIFGTIGSVAAVPVIVAITAAAFSYLTGKLTKQYATRMMIIGAILVAASWVLRLLIVNPALYYATIIMVGLFSLLVSIPLDSRIAARGTQIGSLSAATYRNASSMAFRILLYGSLLAFVEVFKVSFGIATLSLVFLLVVIFLFRSSNYFVRGEESQ